MENYPNTLVAATRPNPTRDPDPSLLQQVLLKNKLQKILQDFSL